MKKVFIAVITSLILLTSCGVKSQNKTKADSGELKISLVKSLRTVRPDIEWLLSDVTQWSLTLTDEEENETVFSPLSASQNGIISVTLPEGTYFVELQGNGTTESDLSGNTLEEPVDFIVYGSVDEVEITSETTVISIYMDLIKQECGNFSYELSFSGLSVVSEDDITISEDESEVSFDTYYVKANLVSAATGEEVALSVTEAGIKNQLPYVIFGKNDIPSGSYYFEVYYKDINDDDYLILSNGTYDPVVRISDGFTSYGSSAIALDLSVKSKYIYVTADSDNNANYNGVNSTYAKGFDAAILWLYQNPDEWDSAELLPVGGTYPAYNIDVNPTRESDAESKSVLFNGLKLSQGNAYIVSNNIDLISLKTSEETVQDFTLISAESDISIEQIELNNVALTITDAKPAVGASIELTTNLLTSYDDNSEPVLTIIYDSTTELRYDVTLNNDENYTLTSVISGNTVEYYTVEPGAAAVTIYKLIPAIEITSLKSVYSVESEPQFIVSPKDESSFQEDTEFVWYINGVLTEDDELTVSYNLSSDSNFKIGKNIITCIVSCKNEKISSSYEFYIYDLSFTIAGNTTYSTDTNKAEFEIVFDADCSFLEDISINWNFNGSAVGDNSTTLTLPIAQQSYDEGMYELSATVSYVDGTEYTYSTSVTLMKYVTTEFVLWNGNTSDDEPTFNPIDKTKGSILRNSDGNIQVFDSVEENQTIGDSPLISEKNCAFCFDQTTGDIYFFTYKWVSNRQLTSITKYDASTKVASVLVDNQDNEIELGENAAEDAVIFGNVYTPDHMAYMNNKLYIFTYSYYDKSNYAFVIDLSDLDNIAITKSILSVESVGVIKSVTADLNSLYITAEKNNFYYFLQFNQNFELVNSTPIFQKFNDARILLNTEEGSVHFPVLYSCFSVRDTLVLDNHLYLVFAECNGSVARGGLLKINLENTLFETFSKTAGNKYTLGLYEIRDGEPYKTYNSGYNSDPFYILTLEEEERNGFELQTNIFYCPNKIVAINQKDKILYIVDESTYVIDPTDRNSTNRLVTVDLENETVTNDINLGVSLDYKCNSCGALERY